MGRTHSILIFFLVTLALAQADIGCFVRGECVQSPTIESFESDNANECLAICKVRCTDIILFDRTIFCNGD